VDYLHFFLNTNHPSLKGEVLHDPGISYDQSNSEYNQYVRDAHQDLKSDSKPVTLIDMEKIFNSHIASLKKTSVAELLLDDGIHLSEEGHNVYIKYLIPIVISKIQEFQKP